ncbi:MAG: Tm-1-like ATP-binding domain-containing protein, partial [Candidatus Poribacteria bacterium]|nr:Tm-1-like ATP-binding domain-containing protein [Candidatus Poribacteria bacterium]
SAIDKAEQPFYSPESETAWIDNLKSFLSGSDVETLELDNHINDEAFAEKLAQTLLDLIG